MKKINKNIDKIQQDHLALLKMVKESLLQNKNNFNTGVKDVIEILKASELDVKKYEAVVQAQELIKDLTQQIVNATNLEDITNLRKKLNYYINKIKNILKKRGIEESVIDTYLEKTTFFRKDIARYIRVLKRENNLSFINNSYANLDNLSEEELQELKKLIRREQNYHTRNIKNSDQRPVVKKGSVIPKEKTKVPFTENLIADESKLLLPAFNPEVEETESHDLTVVPPEVFQLLDNHQIKTISEIEFDDVNEQFTKCAAKFSRQYHIAPTYDYSLRRPSRNIIRFFRNIPRYIYNKKVLKLIENDSNIYYGGNDLISFREYVRQRNSISQGLRCIFSRSYLFTEEAAILNRHRKCSEWLFNFCKENNLEIPSRFFKSEESKKTFN